MKLYIKEKVFSWGDKFTVKDAYGEDKYIVEGEVFSWGKKLHVYDRSGREVAFIKQEVWRYIRESCRPQALPLQESLCRYFSIRESIS